LPSPLCCATDVVICQGAKADTVSLSQDFGERQEFASHLLRLDEAVGAAFGQYARHEYSRCVPHRDQELVGDDHDGFVGTCLSCDIALYSLQVGRSA